LNSVSKSSVSNKDGKSQERVQGIDMRDIIIDEIEKDGDESALVWILVYDFANVRENSAKVRKFYRKLKKLGVECRRTDSELVFESFERAVMVKELAVACGARTDLYGGVEVSSNLSNV